MTSDATFIERDCTIEHEGRTFEAGGAFVTDEYIQAYAGKGSDVTDWHGNVIGTRSLVSRWPIHSWMGSHMHAWTVRVDGRTYSCRGMGEGMSLRGRRIAKERI